MDDTQAGKFGKKKHFELVKKSLIYALEKYYDKFAVIQVENHKISMSATLYTGGYGDLRKGYELHPDIVVTFREKDTYSSAQPKTIIVEAETTPNGLLKDHLRLVAYELLRMGNEDKDRLMLYLAFPSELKGKVKKPEFFNNMWFFDLPEESI